jgi:hypothetical protein
VFLELINSLEPGKIDARNSRLVNGRTYIFEKFSISKTWKVASSVKFMGISETTDCHKCRPFILLGVLATHDVRDENMGTIVPRIHHQSIILRAFLAKTSMIRRSQDLRSSV